MSHRAEPITMLLTALTLCFPIGWAVAQSSSQAELRSQEELFRLLVLAEPEGTSRIQDICESNSSAMSSDLWVWLRNRAVMLVSSADQTEAIVAYGTALQVAKALQNDDLIGMTYLAMGRKCMELGRLKDSIENLSLSYVHFCKAGQQGDVQFVLSQLGQASLLARDFESAKSYANKALQLTEGLMFAEECKGAFPIEHGKAIALSVLGHLSLRAAHYSEALKDFGEALDLFEDLHASMPTYGRYIADALDSLGDVHSLMGNYQTALGFLDRALSTARGCADHLQEAAILQRLATLYLKREDCETAEDYITTSLEVARELGDSRLLMRGSLLLGIVALRREQLERSLPHLARGLELAESLEDADSIILARQHLSAISTLRGDLQGALAEAARSETEAARSKDPLRTAEVAWWKAEILRRLGKHREAINNAEVALSFATEHGLDKLTHSALVTLARSHIAEIRPQAAEDALKRALDVLEELRRTVPWNAQQQQQYLFSNRIAVQHLMIDLLLRQRRETEALSYAERSKGRLLMERLSGPHPESKTLLNDAEHSDERQLSVEIAALALQLRAEKTRMPIGDPQVLRTASKLHEKRRQYSAFKDVLVTRHPELAAASVLPAPLDRENLRRFLNPRSALLEFVVMDSQIVLFVITKSLKDGQIDLNTYTIDVAREDCARQVGRFNWLLANRHPSFHQEARALYELLLRPAEKQLKQSTTWHVVPDDILWNLPFQALEPHEFHYLIEDVTVSYAPSLSILLETSQQESHSEPSFLAFGNPAAPTGAKPSQPTPRTVLFEALPEAETEVQTARRVFSPSRAAVFLGSAATESAFKAQAGAYSTIHLATHGVVDSDNPLYSSLLLADGNGEDGMLEAREVLEMDLSADLVVLSACDTGRGAIGRGEGVIGLTWAFLAAGARNAIVSQWAVKSGTSSRQMISFYNHLKSGLSMAEALRQSALEMLRGNQVTHPFYWASFVLVGSNR